jgi:hypothetical protein
MNKNILLLVIIGVALAILHVPEVTLTLALIAGLAIAAIRLSWIVLQAFSTPAAHSYVRVKSD